MLKKFISVFCVVIFIFLMGCTPTKSLRSLPDSQKTSVFGKLKVEAPNGKDISKLCRIYFKHYLKDGDIAKTKTKVKENHMVSLAFPLGKAEPHLVQCISYGAKSFNLYIKDSHFNIDDPNKIHYIGNIYIKINERKKGERDYTIDIYVDDRHKGAEEDLGSNIKAIKWQY